MRGGEWPVTFPFVYGPRMKRASLCAFFCMWVTRDHLESAFLQAFAARGSVVS